MSRSALVVGEALIDEVVAPDGAVSRHPGGSPANVALGLGRLGVRTRLHTAIGADPDGDLIAAHLAASGVELTALSRTAAPTSTATAQLAEDGSATYRFALRWEPAAPADLGEPTLIHTGSVAAFLAPGASVVREILERGRAEGALLSVDPNIRPSLLPDERAVRRSFDDLLGEAHLVKLSDEDAASLYPGVPPEVVVDLLLTSGPRVAAITLGGSGAILGSGAGRVRVPAVRTAVADTVGAGDSFMAALIHALAFAGRPWDGGPLSRELLAAAGTFAARAAAVTVSRPGADLPTRRDLDDPSNLDARN